MRVKLATKGSGKWESSGGVRSKFGLFVAEVLRALDYLKERNMQDCLKLLTDFVDFINQEHARRLVLEGS